MKIHKGNILASVFGIVCFALLGYGALTTANRLLEKWYTSLLTSKDENSRKYDVQKLLEAKSDFSKVILTDYCIALIDHGNEEEKLLAVRLLGSLRSERGLPSLRRIIWGSDPVVSEPIDILTEEGILVLDKSVYEAMLERSDGTSIEGQQDVKRNKELISAAIEAAESILRERSIKRQKSAN
jgi:hypothetical protein